MSLGIEKWKNTKREKVSLSLVYQKCYLFFGLFTFLICLSLDSNKYTYYI
jgi:hypothetical protein